MNKISFVGNSHLGTISARLSRHHSEYGFDNVEHFVSRTYGAQPMGLVGRSSATIVREILLEDAGRYGTTLDTRNSSAVVAVGLRFSLVQLVDLWRHFQPDGAAADRGTPWLSPGMWQAYVDSAFDDTHLWRIVRALREAGVEKLHVVPQPHPAAWVTERSGEKFDIYRDLWATGDWEFVLTDWDRQVARLEGAGVEVFRQPEATLESPGRTRPSLSKGDPADPAEGSFYERGDFYHMNAAYAEAVVPEIYQWLAETAA